MLQYRKFGNFRENLIFTNSVKSHTCDVKVNDRVISPFHEGFIFTKLHIYIYAKFRENKTLAKISEVTV